MNLRVTKVNEDDRGIKTVYISQYKSFEKFYKNMTKLLIKADSISFDNGKLIMEMPGSHKVTVKLNNDDKLISIPLNEIFFSYR